MIYVTVLVEHRCITSLKAKKKIKAIYNTKSIKLQVVKNFLEINLNIININIYVTKRNKLSVFFKSTTLGEKKTEEIIE